MVSTNVLMLLLLLTGLHVAQKVDAIGATIGLVKGITGGGNAPSQVSNVLLN